MKKLFTILAVGVMFTACSNDDDGPQYLTLTFENVSETSLAGPTSYGDNLYSTYTENSDVYDENYPLFTGYHDVTTDLEWSINIDNGDWSPTLKPEFYSGGIAVSRWNEMETGTADNQCSVYYKASNGKGGVNGSATFAVVNCNDAKIAFRNAETERIFESMWVTNSTYGVIVMEEGNIFSSPLSKENNGWLLLTITGKDKSGAKTGEIEFYLADFLEEDSEGIVKTWKEIELGTLGAVHSIEFSMTGSDTGQYGLNTPAYFCMDNIKVRL